MISNTPQPSQLSPSSNNDSSDINQPSSTPIQDAPPAEPPLPPPAYDGPLPHGTSLLLALPLSLTTPVFPTTLPHALQDRLPNLTYLTRMTSLNKSLADPSIPLALARSRRIRILTAISFSAVFIAIVTAAVVRQNSSLAQFAFLVVPLYGGVYLFTSRQAGHITVLESYAKQWTEEDASQNVNLVWQVNKVWVAGSNYIVKLLILEKVAFEGDGVVHGEGLPMYSQ